jgi:tetratricopeptide (TPR) repeat protein
MTRARRSVLAGCALALAFLFFRGQLATAIVTRGDDALRSGDVVDAIRLYDRATRIDPRSSVAADRLAFYLALRPARARAERAGGVAPRALAAGAADSALFADRAFAGVQLRAWRNAERDFAAAGTLAHDARYEHFAGRMALHRGDRRAAAHYAQLALAYEPSFAPAQALLRTLR